MLLFGNACTKPFNDGIINHSTIKALVVEGMITDAPGPYLIKLSRTLSYNSDTDAREIGAKVNVTDELGNNYPFKEKHWGQYYSDSASFRGQIGRNYTLFIYRKNGAIYKSSVCPLNNKVSIDSIYSSYGSIQVTKQPDDNGNYQIKNGWQIYTDINFMQAKNIRLDVMGIDSFRSTTYYYSRDPILPLTYESEIISDSSYFSNMINFYPTIKSNTHYNTDGTLKNINVAYVIASIRDTNKYSMGKRTGNSFADTTYDIYCPTSIIQINAYSISDITFNYYYNLNKLLNSSSTSLFEPIPTQLKGNMICITDSSTLVFGLFEANSFSTKRFPLMGKSITNPPIGSDTSYFPPPSSYMPPLDTINLKRELIHRTINKVKAYRKTQIK